MHTLNNNSPYNLRAAEKENKSLARRANKIITKNNLQKKNRCENIVIDGAVAYRKASLEQLSNRNHRTL